MMAPLLALALMTSLAPALDPAAPERAEVTPHIADPQGDAYEYNAGYAALMADAACHSAGQTHYCNEQAYHTIEEAYPSVPHAGVPAAASLDVLAVSFSDTPETIEAELTIAEVDETFGGVIADGHQMGYTVCWDIRDGVCHEYMGLSPILDDAGKASFQVFYARYFDPSCGAWESCWWPINGSVEFGAPGKVRMSAPRAMLLEPDAPALPAPRANTWISEHDKATMQAAAAWAPSRPSTWVMGWSVFYMPDLTAQGQDYVLATERSGAPLSLSPHTAMPRGITWGPYDAAVDILNGRLSETPETFTVSLEIASVPTEMSEYAWGGDIVLADGTLLHALLWFRPSGVQTASYVCKMEGCPPEDRRPVPVTHELSPGTPGTLNLTFRRTDIGSPGAGDLLQGATVAGTRIPETAVGDSGTGAATIVVESFDYHIGLHPWRFQMDTGTPHGTVTTHEDATDDAALPAGVLDSAAHFDITHVEAEGISPSMSRITLGIQDLSSIVVPSGYNAVLYAAAVETDRGAFMVGYHKGQSTTMDPQPGQFFCAPDVDVFTETKRDPKEVVWQTIFGNVNLATAGGSGTAGALVFQVPHSCLGDAPDGPVDAKRFAAATYLIPQRPGAVWEADRADVEGVAVLGAAAAPAPASPWWLAPFGIGEFWNILGVAVAVAGGGLAVVAKRRRVSIVQRELKAIDEAHAKHRDAHGAWTKAMTERRARAALLLRQGNLRPDELLVIERRIDLLAAEVAPAPAPEPAEIQVGATLNDRYHVERLLGEGGQGRALLARDEKLARQVVLKTVRTSDMDPQTKRLLLAEARLAASIDHANVVRVHDVVESAQSAVVVMEYIPGGTLRSLLQREGRLAPREAARLMAGVLDGLSAAHALGVVHRDVKPENVLLARDGTPKLTDFGAASEPRAEATMRPLAPGTLRYMSPEQVRGGALDARSDLYSAAAMFVEMLSGRPYIAIEGLDDFQVRAAILEKAPDLGLPDEALAYAGVALRALAKEPAERFASASEMAASLRRVA